MIINNLTHAIMKSLSTKILKRVFAVVSLFLCINIYAQNGELSKYSMVDIGEFKSLDKMYKAQGFINSDTSLIYMYKVEATYVQKAFWVCYKTPCFYIACTPTLIDELKQISSKYKEWAKAAKENNVGKFQKDIEIEFPIVNYSYEMKDARKAQCITKNCEKKKLTFNYYDTSKVPSLFYMVRTSPSWETDVQIPFSLSFGSPEEFDSFIDFLNPENVKKRLREGKISLFN